MRQLIITTIFFLTGLVSSSGQSITEDTYCIKLKSASNKEYFNKVSLDSIPVKWQTIYKMGLSEWGKLLSRFDEEPLTDADNEIFRSVTFGPFNDPKDVQIMRIEKWDNEVKLTVKLIQNLKDSTILVHKKILGPEVWDKFRDLAEKYFITQPSIKKTKGAIHDGSTTVFEGYVSNKYHFLERHVMSMTDPELQEVNNFLFRTAGDIFDVNCKKDIREN